MILDMLRMQGADLSQPREVLHYSYFADQAAADAAAAQEREAGYEVRVEPSAAGDSKWVALATAQRVVDETLSTGRVPGSSRSPRSTAASTTAGKPPPPRCSSTS